MSDLAVYVPIAEFPRLGDDIASGSGIVGSDAMDWFGAERYPVSDRLVIDYEGAIYRQFNIVTWVDKLHHAAGRHLEHYPTMARQLVDAEDFKRVGFWIPLELRVTVDEPDLVRHWLGVDDLGPELVLSWR